MYTGGGLFGSDEGLTLFNYIIGLIKNEWHPDWSMKEERQYRDDLMEFLRKHLDKTHTVKPEESRALADIGIDRRIGIELKLNLNKGTDVDRLIGQLQRYLKDYDYILVVLLGKTDRGIESEIIQRVGELERSLGQSNMFPNMFGKRKLIRVIPKSPDESEVKERKNERQDNFFG